MRGDEMRWDDIEMGWAVRGRVYGREGMRWDKME